MKQLKQNLLKRSLLIAASIVIAACSNTPVIQESTSKQANELPYSGRKVLQGDDIPRHWPASLATKQKVKERKQAVHFFEGMFMRDPYIFSADDGYYYYTCTRLDKIIGGTREDFKTEGVELWRSKDLASWEFVKVVHRFAELDWVDELTPATNDWKVRPKVWAPEIHYINDRWAITHTTSVRQANTLVADKPEGPYKESFIGRSMGHRHDPTFFKDDDGRTYLLFASNKAVEVSHELDKFVGEPFLVEPSNRKMGHEGLYMLKLFDKYVLFGTAWSTDKGRKGSYNLYYATADSIRGPYGERKFFGRFLGHGTPFIDKKGNWWTTAFSNGNYHSHAEINSRTVQNDQAYTPMRTGFMLIPIEPKLDKQGEVSFDIIDKRYRYPGPEEVQQFNLR